MYNISECQFEKAKKMNVIIKPSTNKRKKIDVFDLSEENLICQIGAKNHDCINTLKEKNIPFPEILQKREKYFSRHKSDLSDKFMYEAHLLWCF